MDLDSLENLAEPCEATVVTATADVSPPPPAAVFPTQPPRASGDGMTLKELAMAGLPSEWRERLIADAGHAGVKHDQDVGWLLLGSVINSAAAALAAGASAEELSRLLESLPQRMLDGARLAGGDVAGEIRLAVKDVNVAILQTGKVVAGSMSADVKHVQKIINEASVLGADKIKTATDGLIGKLDAAVEQKKEEGAREWSMIAEKAAVDSAKTALGKIALRGGLFTALLLLLGALIGGGGLWAARTISGDYLPSGVQTFQSPAGSDFIRVTPGRATVGNAIQCGADLCIPVVPAK